MPQAQTYRNHRRYYWPHHFFVQPVLIVYFTVQVRRFFEAPTFDNGLLTAVALALVVFAVTARAMALKAQNRVIRLEERLRLATLMPDEERGRIDDLSTRHLVGLRFASDAEVADLARRCLSGELQSSEDVKKNVQDWRPDYSRV